MFGNRLSMRGLAMVAGGVSLGMLAGNLLSRRGGRDITSLPTEGAEEYGRPDPQQERLWRTVVHLASEIGPRNIHHYGALCAAQNFITRAFKEAGLPPVLQTYETRGRTFANIEAEIRGESRSREIVIIGAHYDTHKHSPGADDNASAVAALLELARHFSTSRTARTLRFVAFTNEESPFTHGKDMGSRVYAERCRARGEKVVAMISLEMLGCYSDREGSQLLSLGGRLLPRKGNFLALVANKHSQSLLAGVEEVLGRQGRLPYQSLVLPTHLPGAWSSDHWSFWKAGYPALMLTDTARLRNSHYHGRGDTPEKIDISRLSKAVEDMKPVIRLLAMSR
ncbi:M20/M25/M40 family metallo-hydrolase [Telmatospirillum sp. J64-1]|uniref:M20/M25/M40 family metallo-hydrolase n=1 Tax=Telmatospirillum sp. J64-1 TaxID=2502183 RepID=UPI00115CE5A2|nr:M20/M25/M40 family metallo-hydrolase [Telmatospirillum sp. J64-1]